MTSQNANHTQFTNDNPERLRDILPGFLDGLEAGTEPPDRSTEASIRYEEGNNAVLRDAACQPGVTDAERADLAEIIHEGDVALRALREGRGHSPNPGDGV